MLQFLLLPLLATVVLTGIHAYLGIRVVERGAIFVALSLTQIAALGTTCAYFAGYDLHSPVASIWSVGFTIIGAALFVSTSAKREAIAGIAYAVSAAAAILAMSRAPEGTEHLKDILAGNILMVSRGMVMKTAVLYAFVGLFHYVFRQKKLPDFLFYTSIGIVVTASVAIAGVLLAFAYLIAPPVAAMMFSQSIGKRLAIAWTMGALVSAIGIVVSFEADLPTAATIVCMLGVTLAIMVPLSSRA